MGPLTQPLVLPATAYLRVRRDDFLVRLALRAVCRIPRFLASPRRFDFRLTLRGSLPFGVSRSQRFAIAGSFAYIQPRCACDLNGTG